jgi:hypothetical protein
MKVSFDCVNLNYTIVEITRLILYRAKLYASVIPNGEIYCFDSREWRLAYELPKEGKNEFSLWAGGCWEAWEWSKDEHLYFGGFSLPGGMFSAVIIRHDGSRWERINLTEQELLVPESREEVYGIHEFNGNLYVKTHGGRIYTSSDGLNWRYMKTLDGKPELNAIEAHGMAVFDGKLYVLKTGAGIYAFDGKNWSKPISPEEKKYPSSIATYKGKLYAGFYNILPTTEVEDRPFVCSLEDGFFDVESYHYPNTIYVTADGENWRPFASFEEPVRRMKSIDGYLWFVNSKRNAQGPGQEIHNSLWRYDGMKIQRLISLPGVITDIAMYKGVYYISNAHNAELQGMRPGTMAFIYSFFPDEVEHLARLKPEPRILYLWKNKRIEHEGDFTEPVPVAGYTNKTLYLISDQEGVLNILGMPTGEESGIHLERDKAIEANHLFKFSLNYGIAWLRLRFIPKRPATVNAYIHLEG